MQQLLIISHLGKGVLMQIDLTGEGEPSNGGTNPDFSPIVGNRPNFMA
jgi:hypothetical protein